jgi:hypothetical protein
MEYRVISIGYKGFRAFRWFRVLSLMSLLVILISQTGCSVYSFTGASISPEVKSVSIDFFPSYAPLAPANMPQAFTAEPIWTF